MLLRQIKYFITVVDCNSFTQAAEQLYISQSAISQQIRALENDLGAELICRGNRSFRLTSAGEYFYRRSKALLSEAEDIQRQTTRIGQNTENQLRIGYLNIYNGLELHQAIAEFSSLYPEMDITISAGTHEELYRQLRTGEADLVLNDQRRAFSDEYVNFELAVSPAFAELSIRHCLSARERVQIEDLKPLPCILLSSKEQYAAEERYYRDTLGFSGSFLFSESLEEARLMVAGNRGFLPIDGVGTLPPVPSAIRRLPLCRKNEPLRRRYCAFWQKERTNCRIEEFAEILKKLIIRAGPQGR